MSFRLDLHVFHHFPQELAAPPWAKKILDTLERISTKEDSIMTNIADVKAKADATLAQVQAETSVVNAVKLVVDHNNEQIATLKQQLADAIANGVDPAALQALSDTIDAIQTANTANTEVVAAAVAAGTAVEQPAPDA